MTCQSRPCHERFESPPIRVPAAGKNSFRRDPRRFFGQPLAMPVVKKFSAKKSQTPKALGAVARQQLLLVNGLLDEVARNYVARLHREIAELTRSMEKKQAGPGFKRREL